MHRRLLHDDNYGVAEALNETAFDRGLLVKGQHYVIVGSTSGDSPSLAAQQRELAQRKIMSPWLFFTTTDLQFTEWQSTYKMEVIDQLNPFQCSHMSSSQYRDLRLESYPMEDFARIHILSRQHRVTSPKF